MDRFDRIYRLHGLLASRRIPVPLKDIMATLECSKATATRCIEELRNHLKAPLDYDRKHNGYYYNQTSSENAYELPGLWFSAEELNGLLICHQILQNISPGILSEQIGQLQQRIDELFKLHHQAPVPISRKIKLLTIGRRLKDDAHFKKIAAALFKGQQINIHYNGRGENAEQTQRTISPQQLIYYRDNWYIAAYCHYRDELRVFAIDNISSTKVLEQTAETIGPEKLEPFLTSSYGIFSGTAQHRAVLEFSKSRAQWVADETWHPKQQGQWLDNGNYQLSIPFNDSRELVMDILKHGAEVEVTAPEFLRADVKEKIAAMHRLYEKK